MGQEYIFPLFWCATDAKTLGQNIGNIEIYFYLNGEAIPDTYTLTYDQSPKGWRCRYKVVALSGWVANSEYLLEAQRTIRTKVFDGEKHYPPGTYVYELNIAVR